MKILSQVFLSTFLIVFLFFNSIEVSAQSNWEAGVRFGNDFALDVTIPLAASPRLHAAVYFNNDVAVGTYFDWMYSLSGGPRGLKFYPGVGPEFYFGNNFDVAVAGDFGMEYSFDFPLTIGLDWRPHFMVTDSMNFSSRNWGFTARFRLGEGSKFVRTN